MEKINSMQKNNHSNFRIDKLLFIGIFSLISIFSYAQIFECETYTTTSGCVVIAGTPSYADMGGQGSWFEMTNINVSVAGTYQLTMTYANGKAPLRPCDILVNGVALGSIDFPGTTGWAVWGTVVFPTVVLNASANTIRLTATTADGGCNFDNFILTKVADDIENPTAPTGLVVSTLRQSSFTLSWTASTDNVRVMSYEVFSNGVSQGTTTETSLDIKNLTPATLYQMTVVAKDLSNNLSVGGVPLPVTTTIADIINPSAPTGLSAKGIGANSFILSWIASTDNVGISKYEVFINGLSSGITYPTRRVVVGLLPSTTYNITIKSYDEVGNISAFSNQLTVNTIADQPVTVYDESKNYIGMGLCSMAEWEEVFIFANCMVNNRATMTGTGCTIGADDWPSNDLCSTYIGADVSNQHGRYHIIWDGDKGDVTLNGMSKGTISPKVYDPVRNETSYYVDITQSGKGNLWVSFKNTGGVGMKNVRVYRPTYPGSLVSHDTTEIFHRKTLEILSKFNFLRAMDFLATNSSNHVNWSDRNIIGQRAQHKVVGGKDIYGGAWEYLTLLANQTKKDLWINVPHQATDDYITKVAQLFKYGSDGVNPYTSVQANPKYPPLDPSLKLMVEYSNEIWNFGPSFKQSEWANSVGKSIGLSGHSEFYAKRVVEMSTIFRNVFGDSEMMTRVRPLLEWQKAGLDSYGNGSGTGSIRLFYLEKNYPQPVDYYVWGGGCSGYYNPCAGANIDNVWDGCGMNEMTWAYESQEYAAYFTSAFGLRRVVYEGGPSFGDVNGGTGAEPVGDAANNDERIALEVIDHQNVYSKVGGNAFAYFTLGGGDRWGYMKETTVPNKKYDGIVQVYNQPREAITSGYSVTSTTPIAIPGNQWRLYNKTVYSAVNATRTDAPYKIATVNIWHSYHFNVNKTAKYRVKINYSSTGTGVFALYHGAKLLANPAIVTSTNSTAWFTFDGNPYLLQAVRLKVVSGTLPTITSVEVAEDFSTGTSQITKASSTTVFPTFLTEGKTLNVSNSNFALPVQVSIYTQTGALVYRVDKVVGDIEISSSKLPKGILVCVLKSAQETNMVKISNL